jgi:DNA-binding response OmpR family regulator
MTSVFIVDDDPAVRQILERVLKAEGYAVRSAGDAETAMAAIRSGGAVDILVTDMRLPHASGRELAAQLRADRVLKVLYVSGQTDASESTRPLAGDTLFLAKPFSRADVLASVHALEARLEPQPCCDLVDEVGAPLAPR